MSPENHRFASQRRVGCSDGYGSSSISKGSGNSVGEGLRGSFMTPSYPQPTPEGCVKTNAGYSACNPHPLAPRGVPRIPAICDLWLATDYGEPLLEVSGRPPPRQTTAILGRPLIASRKYSASDRSSDCFSAIGDLELLQNVVHMMTNGVIADI